MAIKIIITQKNYYNYNINVKTTESFRTCKRFSYRFY